MFLSMALMAGGAGAQNFAFTDMSEVEHISVADGKITVKKTDGSSNTLVSTHPGTVEYRFKDLKLRNGFTTEALNKAIFNGKVECEGTSATEVSTIYETLRKSGKHIQELVITGATITSRICPKNVNTIKFIDCTFENYVDAEFWETDLKSLHFSNVEFKAGLEMVLCTGAISVVFDNCTFSVGPWVEKTCVYIEYYVNEDGYPEVVDDLKAFFDENDVSYTIYDYH